MEQSPFVLLRPYARKLSVALMTKADDVCDDASLIRVTGAAAIVSLKQVHGTGVCIVREASSRMISADALLTDTTGLTLTIRFADCQNFVLYEPKKNILGLVHAGWRGVEKKILTGAFAALANEWGVAAKDVLVAAGPSLCTACADFTDPLREAPGLTPFVRGRCIDLQAAANQELAAIGVRADHIERMPDCTRCMPETYWTYRGGDRERVANGYVNCLACTLIQE